MYNQFSIQPPFFEFGPKAYLFGDQLLSLAKHADRLVEKYDVRIIFTPQYVDVPMLVCKTKNLSIFAQHMDPLGVGRGVGSVLPEAIKAVGAAGVMLNHVERKLSADVVAQTIKRADEVGLATMTCADTPEDAVAIARLKPNIIIVESPELIGGGKRESDDNSIIARTNECVWEIDPDIRVLHGAGINNGQDVYDVMATGAQATGSTSGIILASDPFSMFEEMISAMRKAWDDTH